MNPKQFKNLEDLEKEVNAYVKITKKTYKQPKDLPPHLVYYKDLEDNGLLPLSNKDSTTKRKFNDHLKYKILVNDLNYPNGNNDVDYDTWYKDIFYGRVDYKNNPIYHNYWIFQKISSNSTIDVCVFDFVADAFDQMKEMFNKKKRSPNSVYLQTLDAKNGNTSTINPEKKYLQYVNKKFQEFLNKKNKQLKTNENIKNFKDFKKIFINHLKSEEGILTFQGFFDNVNIDIYDSYLAFDVYDDRGNPSDSTKLAFLQDPNYNIYETTARQAGFFIDPNKPWRLVANLQSKPILAAMKRRYVVAQKLLKTKNSIKKIIGVKRNQMSEVVQQKDILVLGIPYYGGFVEDKKYILNFADYFKKEIPDLERPTKVLKDIFATYIDGKKIINSKLSLFATVDDKVDGKFEIDFPKKKINLEEGVVFNETLYKIYKAIFDISTILEENEATVDFIYQSLESQLKVLEVINKPVTEITNKDIYNAVYCQTSDYAYFTYLPKKLEEFYEIFLNQKKSISFDKPKNLLENKINQIGKNNFNHYHSYVVFSKTASGNTKAIYNKREPVIPEKIKLSNDLQNNFYSLDFLIDHLEHRLFEEKVNIEGQNKDKIINQVKVLYEKSLDEYKNKGNYSYYRNLAMSIIETYIYNLVESKKPNDVKKAPFFAQQYFYKAPEVEPLIMTERICLTLPERADILIEEEVCGTFAGDISVAEETPQLFVDNVTQVGATIIGLI